MEQERIELQIDRAIALFPARFSEAMARAGVKPTPLSEATGIAINTIRCYRRGDRNPTMKNLVALCAALGVGADWLLGLDTADSAEVGE